MHLRGTGRGGAMLAAVLLLGACTAPLDEAGIRRVATDWFTAHPHETGAHVQDVLITDLEPATLDGHTGFDVAIQGRLVLPGLPQGMSSDAVLFIDPSNGSVTVVSQR